MTDSLSELDRLRRWHHLAIAAMDLDELQRLEAVVLELHQERGNWAQYPGFPRWHFVLRYEPRGSVVTACNGRWDVKESYEIAGRPPIAQRCEHCQERFVEANRQRLALDVPFGGELAVVAPHTAKLHTGPLADDGRDAIETGLSELRDAEPVTRPRTFLDVGELDDRFDGEDA